MFVINFIHLIQNLSTPQRMWNRLEANVFVFRIKLFSDLIIKDNKLKNLLLKLEKKVTNICVRDSKTIECL